MEENKTYTQSERDWAMLCHLAAIAGYLFIPFGSIIGPLIFWTSRKDNSEWVNLNGKASMNFQLSMLLYLMLTIPLCIILIGFPILVFLKVFQLVCIVIASIKASHGEVFKYPLSIPFIQ